MYLRSSRDQVSRIFVPHERNATRTSLPRGSTVSKIIVTLLGRKISPEKWDALSQMYFDFPLLNPC